MYIVSEDNQTAIAYIDKDTIRILENNKYKLVNDNEWLNGNQDERKSNK